MTHRRQGDVVCIENRGMRIQESLVKSEPQLSAHLTVQLCRAHNSVYSVFCKSANFTGCRNHWHNIGLMHQSGLMSILIKLAQIHYIRTIQNANLWLS